jgi:proline iminopeptidase
MTARLPALLIGAFVGASAPPAITGEQAPASTARESAVPVTGASLFARDIGRGPALVALHGGPDFDHAYLLPDFDRLADAFRIVYYDQRGRGRSAAGVRAEDVSLSSELDDLDAILRHFKLDRPALMGHSWGAVLALEYAIRHPTKVSRLILMNPAPASTADFVALRTFYLARIGDAMDRQRAISAGAAYQQGDPEAVAERYRIHFKPALARVEHYERLMTAMKAAFIRQGRDGILKARAVEDRLMLETWQRPDYNLMPKLAGLQTPALVIYGDHDFIPPQAAANIARALPKGRLITLTGCGHFAYLECPDEVRRAFVEFSGIKR